MTIKVERTLSGLRFTTPKGEREFINDSEWSRKTAIEALNLFEHVYHFNRKNIRFKHT